MASPNLRAAVNEQHHPFEAVMLLEPRHYLVTCHHDGWVEVLQITAEGGDSGKHP